MLNKQFDDISILDLQELVTVGIPEGRHLEFKRDHYGRNDEAKREFAADVSAFANAHGGLLLIGIEEKNGVASEIVGVEARNPDILIGAIDESLRASIEPLIHGLRVRWIEFRENLGIVAIKVPRSWNSPHRVTVARDNRFYVRDENGKHPMAVDELRRAFLFATEVEERIRQFRHDRIDLLLKNEGPLGMDMTKPKLIIHVVPLVSFSEGIRINSDLREKGIPPIGGGGYNFLYSIDGFVTYSGPEEKTDHVRAFSTLFRNGSIEAVASLHIHEKDSKRIVYLTNIENGVLDAIHWSLEKFRKIEISPPYYLMISVVGIKGATAIFDSWGSGIAYPYRTDKLFLPDMAISSDDLNQKSETFLQPLFNLLWNGFGHAGSPNYTAAGEYVQRR
ncbi:helix-turn-helix domain-containing protein [Elstera cyanobacteriorum]|uniref:AlbA family DNA-binding domain-containing protein n=1 Tax=Elstera cyanobacteriorum TaxID=2022747 RepID=UPI0023522503|nr:ATP-binding protein [Elstera cyanobacteriorum]MCK6442016.1 ATP-binding protein [Elstera cyanobacteriorum]